MLGCTTKLVLSFGGLVIGAKLNPKLVLLLLLRWSNPGAGLCVKLVDLICFKVLSAGKAPYDCTD